MLRPSVLIAFAIPAFACLDPAPEPVPEPDPPTPTETVVRIEVDGGRNHLLVAVSDERTDWRALPGEADGTYEVAVTGAYRFAVVCGSPGDYSTQLVYALPSDGRRQVSCWAGSPAIAHESPFVPVRGRMIQPGTVQLLDERTGTQGPWTYELEASVGTHDLYAYDDRRLVIHRALEVTEAVTVPDLDLEAGVTFAQTPITLTNKDAGESVLSQMSMFTGHGFFFATFDGPVVRRIPVTDLGPMDFQFTTVVTETLTTRRTIDFAGGPTTLTLLPLLQGVTLAATRASWTELPAHSLLTYNISRIGGGNRLEVQASARWTHRSADLDVDLEIPGYRGEWRVGGERALTLTIHEGNRSSSVAARM